MPATVYSYDPRTHQYLGETVADDDPEQEGELLFPAFTTLEAPPQDIPPDKAAYWNRTTWDLRNKDVEPLPPPEEVTDAVMQKRAEALAQGALDKVARSLGYDNILTAVTYADEPAFEKFQVEGRRLRRLRSLVWAECYSMLAEVQAGSPWLTEDEFTARLPTYEEMVIMEAEGGS